MRVLTIEQIYEQYGWNGKFFLLTRDHTVEITTVGGGYDDVPIHEKGCLFHYANQCSYEIRKITTDIDKFGRNYLDKMFIALCMYIHCEVYFPTPKKMFKLLTTRKEGDKYIVRVQYDDVDLEMEIEEMYNYFSQKLKEK